MNPPSMGGVLIYGNDLRQLLSSPVTPCLLRPLFDLFQASSFVPCWPCWPFSVYGNGIASSNLLPAPFPYIAKAATCNNAVLNEPGGKKA